MTKYTLPFLFLNLSGEMIYILDQRLRAQKIPIDKSTKVLNDIIGIMLNQRFLEELFKPQEVYNKDALRSVFNDLAHTSIMRLNEDSMGKLYDLMRMVFKYQVFAASQPQDLLLITLNHLDAIRSLVCSQSLLKQVDSAYFLLVKTYGQMGGGELQRLRYHILNFFQDMRIRVSIFMRQNIQNNCGSFIISPCGNIPYRNEVPGSIRIFGTDGCIQDLLSFPSGGEYIQTIEVGSTELRGARHILLGTNIYSSTTRVESEGLDRCSMMETHDSHKYRQELNLLVKQLLGSPTHSSTDIIKLDLFTDHDTNFRSPSFQNQQSITRSETEPVHTESLHKVMTEMSFDGTKEENASNVNVVELMENLL